MARMRPLQLTTFDASTWRPSPPTIRALPMHTNISPMAQRLQSLQYIMVHSMVEVSISYIGPNLHLPQQVCNLHEAVALPMQRSYVACPLRAFLGCIDHSLTTQRLFLKQGPSHLGPSYIFFTITDIVPLREPNVEKHVRK